MKDRLPEQGSVGIYRLDGSFESAEAIRERLAVGNTPEPQFETPLVTPKNFDYWSERFEQRQRQYQETYEALNNHVEISFPQEEQVCINIIGDLHVGEASVDYARIREETDAIIRSPNSYVVLAGDLVDGLFFNPGQFEQMEQTPEQVAYMRAYMERLAEHNRLLAFFSGDHDGWQKKSGMNPYMEFSQRYRARYMEGLGFITVNVGDQEYRLAGAHQLPGNSMYNKNHPQIRAEKFGGARGADVVFSGHNHQKGISSQALPEYGGQARMFHAIAIGPYKSTDGWLRKKGFTQQSPEEMYGAAIILSGGRKHVDVHYDILEANERMRELSRKPLAEPTRSTESGSNGSNGRLSHPGEDVHPEPLLKAL